LSIAALRSLNGDHLVKTLIRRSLLPMIVVLCCGAGSGCGEDESPKPEGGGVSVDLGPAARQGPADSADKAVLAAIQGLKQNHLDAIWDFLPESYQKDLNELVHNFAERMDAEFWTRTVAVVRKLTGVLKTKKEFLRGPDQAGTDWASLADILETILDSELADLEKLKKADAGKILAGTGGKILGQLRAFSKLTSNDSFAEDLNRLSRTEVKLISSTGDTARLKLTATDEEPRDVDFVRIEGKWIPQSMANEWIENMGEARARLSVLSPESFAEQKPQYIAILGAVDDVLDKLRATKSRDEFNGVLQESVSTLLPMLAAIAGPPQPPEGEDDSAAPETPVATEFVTVIIKASLNDAAQDDLRDKLKAVADDRERASTELTADDESTIIKVGPIEDVEAFVEKIDFLKITGVDAKTRTITATMKK